MFSTPFRVIRTVIGFRTLRGFVAAPKFIPMMTSWTPLSLGKRPLALLIEVIVEGRYEKGTILELWDLPCKTGVEMKIVKPFGRFVPSRSMFRSAYCSPFPSPSPSGTKNSKHVWTRFAESQRERLVEAMIMFVSPTVTIGFEPKFDPKTRTFVEPFVLAKMTSWLVDTFCKGLNVVAEDVITW